MLGGGRGVGFSSKIPGGGVLQEGGGWEARGREGVCGESGERGLNIFFGAEIPTKFFLRIHDLENMLSGVGGVCTSSVESSSRQRP